MAALTLHCEREADPAVKILAAAKRAGLEIKVSGAAERTKEGILVPVLKAGAACTIRHTAPILLRIARTKDCGLLGESFVEEGIVDSWLQWATEEDVRFEAADALLDPVLDVLEAALKSRTFLVGDQLTLADISVSVSLRKGMKAKGVDACKKTYPSVVRWWLMCKQEFGIPEAGAAVSGTSGAKGSAPKGAASAASSEADQMLKVNTTAKLVGIDVKVTQVERSPCGLAVPVAKIGAETLRYTSPILHRLARAIDCGLLGRSFAEEALVDSWMQWTQSEVEHHFEVPDAEIAPVLDVLEAALKSRTFLVGERLTLADISASISLRIPIQRAGVDSLQKSYPSAVRWWQTCKHQLEIPDAGAAASASKSAPKAAASAADKAAGEDEATGGSKKGDKKQAAKDAKEEAKKKKEAEELAAKEAKARGPDVPLDKIMDHTFGSLLIQSQCKTGRTWTSVKDLTPELKDKMVWIRARVHNSRKQGAKLCFLTLRQDLCTVQAVVFGPEMAGFAGSLPDESVVDIYGKVAVPENEVVSCSQSKVEVGVEKVFCIGRSVALPLQLADASRSEEELEKDPKLIRVGQDVRLDNRVIDLRTVANQAILRLQSGVCHLFREFLSGEGFVEIHTPKLIPAASEGGADVFRVDYFEGNAFLAQSPQLYKQMALMTDLPKVFEIGPVFRSEQSFTHRHMTEFTGLDLEMTFKDHYSEVLDILDGLFNFIFSGLTKRFPKEIEAVRGQYPFQDLKWKYPCLKLKYPDAIRLLRSKGPALLEKRLAEAKTDYDRKLIQRHLESVRNHDEEEDISTEDEKVLGVVIRQEYGEEFYMIDKFPKAVRPFYTMADPSDDRWTNSYDLFLRGEEITSGAQRIHDPAMLVEKATSMGVDMKPIQPYVDSFKYGAFPHAGAGIGLERVVMLFLNLNNIRKTSMFPRDPKRLTP